MQQVVSITEKWQVNIPKRIRKAMGLKKHSKALVRLENKKIVLEPIESSILKFAGKYTTSVGARKINITKIRDHIDYSKW